MATKKTININQSITNLTYLTKIKRQFKKFSRSISAINFRIGSDDSVFKTSALVNENQKLNNLILKELTTFPIWNLWLSKINGVGAVIASDLILAYYYRFAPICTKCNIEMNQLVCPNCSGTTYNLLIKTKDFPTVRKFWKYMGQAVIDGKIERNKKGIKSNFNPIGKQICWNFREQINRLDSDYKKFFIKRKELLLKENTEGLPLAHIHNRAGSQTSKLFLSHFWCVARILEGLPLSHPYDDSRKRKNIILPYYFNLKEGMEYAKTTNGFMQDLADKNNITNRIINQKELSNINTRKVQLHSDTTISKKNGKVQRKQKISKK